MTGWVGENPFASLPTALYGVVFVLAAVAWQILQWEIIRQEGSESKLKAAVRRDFKGKVSLGLYLASIPLAFVRPWIAQALFVLVAMLWFMPDPRIERSLHHHGNPSASRH
jgi:uncharacterized membrane protein